MALVENSNKTDFKNIQKEIKFLTNSDSRIKLLQCLIDKPQTLKSLQKSTNLSNSSISTNMSQLEEKRYVINENDVFLITNKCKILFISISNLIKSVNILNEDFSFVNSHKIENYEFNSFKDLPMLAECELVKSSSVDIFKVFNVFKEFAIESEYVKTIFPFMHPQILEILEWWIENDIEVKLILDEEVFDIFMDEVKKYGTEHKIFAKATDKPIEFVLIVTDKGIVIGSYRDDGKFDQNAVYTSTSEDAILWANNAFEEYERLCGDYIHYQE